MNHPAHQSSQITIAASDLLFELFEVSIDQFQIILQVLEILFVVGVWTRLRSMQRNGRRFLGRLGKEVLYGLVETYERAGDGISRYGWTYSRAYSCYYLSRIALVTIAAKGFRWFSSVGS
jgi:hypothetical protein